VLAYPNFNSSFVGYLKHKDMKNAENTIINGIDCKIDLIESATTKGSLVWNADQSEQVQAPPHTTIKFRVVCKNRQLAEDVNAELVRKAYQVARTHGCTMQHSGGMTSQWNATKFGATFHGENSALCADEMI